MAASLATPVSFFTAKLRGLGLAACSGQVPEVRSWVPRVLLTEQHGLCNRSIVPFVLALWPNREL